MRAAIAFICCYYELKLVNQSKIPLVFTMMIRKMLFCAALVSMAAACTSATKSKFGLSKSAPDEFTVASNPPLIMPPILTLPEPGRKDGQKEAGASTKSSTSHSTQEDAEIRKHMGMK